MSLVANLPTPVPPGAVPSAQPPGSQYQREVAALPAYGHRKGFVPRTASDFGDGGAFPEIHVAQYPRDMGRVNGSHKGKTLGLSAGQGGAVDFSAPVALGLGGCRRPATVVHARYQDLVPIDPGQEGSLARPVDGAIAESAQKTKVAIDKIIGVKVAASHVTNVGTGARTEQYLRYTPAHANGSHISGAAQRVIHMMEMPKDPMEPPEFKHKRVPGGPPSPPVPVMHSPPRKLTIKDQQEWKIPPCISNWKNAKGYTIPLDKRLAADGRDTQETTINDKFAKLSESLYVAERVAREDISKRAEASRRVALKRSEEQDAQLRRLAQRVVEGKQQVTADAGYTRETQEQLEGRKQRDELRDERKRERQRDYNIAMAAPEKRSKLTRDLDRDISEQIALGQASQDTHEPEYDQRLYNHTEGMSSGFGAEDGYSVYDKPLFRQTGRIYKASSQEETFDTNGLIDALSAGKTAVPRPGRHGHQSRPVHFEKEQTESADPFGGNSRHCVDMYSKLDQNSVEHHQHFTNVCAAMD
eukprot:COSAG05_NODE_1859_length_3948_cov_23.008576_3_plen_527_part_01